MRFSLATACLFLAACGAEEIDESLEVQTVGAQVAVEREPDLEVDGLSASTEVAQLEPFAGQEISLLGRLDHIRGIHGILVLKSGLKIYLPHLDQHLRGRDWFRWIGRPVTVSGILHTYTKDIEGYRGPSLEFRSLSGE
jgi:hypothetical protein